MRCGQHLAKELMSQLFSASCSALAAINSVGDDRKSHWVTATRPVPQHYPTQLSFSLPNMTSESGWTTQRPVALWISGSNVLARAFVARVEPVPLQGQLNITIEAFMWSHNTIRTAVEEKGRWAGRDFCVDMCARLAKQSSRADPIYDILSRTKVCSDVPLGSTASDILDTIYGRQPFPPPQPGDEVALSYRLTSCTVRLTEEQRAAVQLGVSSPHRSHSGRVWDRKNHGRSNYSRPTGSPTRRPNSSYRNYKRGRGSVYGDSAIFAGFPAVVSDPLRIGRSDFREPQPNIRRPQHRPHGHGKVVNQRGITGRT